MSLVFYHSPMSTAEVTNIVLAELDVPHERVVVELRQGGTKTAEYLKLNPNGKVPLIVHDGTPIFESAAITMYLGEVFGVDKGLYPAPGTKRGEAMKWIVWANVSLAEAVSRWARNTMEWAPADHRNEKAGEAALEDLHGLLGILNGALEGRAYLGGDDYTLADAHVGSLVDWVGHMKVNLAAYPHLQAWIERCGARPAHAKMRAAAAT